MLLEINQRQTGDRVLAAAQMGRRLGDHHLERRADMRLDEMAAQRRAVGASEDDMRMDHRLTRLFALGDVADQRDDLDLLGHRVAAILLALPVEEAQHRVAQGADAGEVRGIEMLLAREGEKTRHDLVAPVEDEGEAARAVLLQEFRLHRPTPPMALAVRRRMAAAGSFSLGSGTASRRISSMAWKTTAFMTLPLAQRCGLLRRRRVRHRRGLAQAL